MPAGKQPGAGAGCLQRCRSRCERQRPGHSRARRRWERGGSCSQQQQRMLGLRHPSLPSHLHLTSICCPTHPSPSVPRRVSRLSPPAPSTPEGRGAPWEHAKRREVFSIRQTGNPSLVLWGQNGWKSPAPSLSHWHHGAGGSGATWLCGRQCLSQRPHLPVPAVPPPQPWRGWDMGSSTHRPPVLCSAAAPCSVTSAKARMLLLTSKFATWGHGGALSPPDPDRATPAVHRPLQMQILMGNLCFYPLQALLPPALPPGPACGGKALRNKTISNAIKAGWWEFVFWGFLLFYCFPKE